MRYGWCQTTRYIYLGKYNVTNNNYETKLEKMERGTNKLKNVMDNAYLQYCTIRIMCV